MIIASLLLSLFGVAKEPKDLPASIYDFKVPSLRGDTIDFAAFRGKKILIVNTASKCGLTPQYKQLEELYKLHNDKLIIIGFPANNFLFQEPKANEEIAEFCQLNYGVSFPMSEKISVKGKSIAPIYYWLTHKKYNGLKDSKVKWNFQKYLIDEHGQLSHIFPPSTSPMSQEILNAITQ